jgi:hypothetical protein
LSSFPIWATHVEARGGIGIAAVPGLPKAVTGVQLPYPAIDQVLSC